MRGNGLLLLCLAVSLTGCSGRSEVIRETVEKRVPVYVAMPEEVTADVPEPAAPELRCMDRGRATLCNDDLAEWIEQLRAWGNGLRGQLAKVRDLQAKEVDETARPRDSP